LLFSVPMVFVLTGLLMARLPMGFVFSRALLVLPFVGMVAVFLPFTKGQEIVWCWKSLGICVYQEGIDSALTILIKGCLAIVSVAWLVFTTPFNRLLQAMRALKIPQVVVAVLAFLFRYLDIMADESLRIRRARIARSAGKKLRWSARSTGGLVGILFLRALDRAERVHRAMCARGFDGEMRTLTLLKMKPSDLFFGAVVMAFVCIYILLVHPIGG
jgi:cobalt/nickel transport system permease protein